MGIDLDMEWFKKAADIEAELVEEIGPILAMSPEIYKKMNKKFDSVEGFLKDVDPEFAEEFKKQIDKRMICSDLTAMRAAKELSQKEFAELAGWEEVAVEKLETGWDDDLTIGQIRTYLRICK